MKKFFLLLLLFTLILFPYNNVIYANSSMLICGEAIDNGNSTKNIALENAKKKAVSQALSRFIAPDNNDNSIFYQIINKYNNYIIGNADIIKTQKAKNKLLCFCKVSVDYTKLENDLQQSIKKVQYNEKNQDDEIFFFLRIKNLDNETLKKVEQNKLINFYADAFQDYGFNKGMSDEVAINTIKKYNNLNYDEYVNIMKQNIKNDVSISIAVIGEINLDNCIIDEQGVNLTGHCNFLLVKNDNIGNCNVIGTFSDKYTIRRANRTEAQQMLLQKAAYNSSKYLSKITLDYWQKSKI